MRALTVRQPWAWAIMHGGKDVENRGRNIAGSYRGPVAIHAAARFATADMLAVFDVCKSMVLAAPTSAIIGMVDLLDVHRADECWTADMQRLRELYRRDREAFNALPDSGAGGIVGKVRCCSRWAEDDGHHLLIGNPRPCEPIPCKGRLGLWTVPAEVEAQIVEAMS